ncbi:MAG TPA: hypothetical protein VMN58_06510 [Acidimicrobiales bacterium]|nr:hypothetical protein [Acidimicrobiales bacterium]
MALDAERRSALLGSKLAALAAHTTGTPVEATASAFPDGAALRHGSSAWVLVEANRARALGPALAWARQAGAGELDLVVDGDDPSTPAGTLARRATQMAVPPRVWVVSGTHLVPAAPAALEPEPAIEPGVRAFAEVLRAAGCDPVVEHGRLVGEVAGLEVARAEVGPDGPHLEIGVGRFDREAHALVSADRPTVEALADVVALVRRHRTPGAADHPLQRLSAARHLRSRLVAEPALVGADHLAPVPSTLPAPDLRMPWPATAAGTTIDGGPLVVVCSTGIDLDLVPTAADARLADGRGARLVLAVPERDVHPVTEALAAALAEPAEVVGIAPLT